MYYTNEHEWIDYRGYTAYVGVCKGKLSGINDIESAVFCEALSNSDQGTVIVSFISGHKLVKVHMPVDGKIIEFNSKLIENPSMILSTAQHSVWIARISPNAPYKREGLMQEHQYNAHEKKGKGILHG